MRIDVVFRRAAIIGLVGAVALLCYVGLWPEDGPSPTSNDITKLRRIVELVVSTKALPMKDGAFDPYAFVRQGKIRSGDYNVFRSERSKVGPTDDEIRRGDYANFPWARCARARPLWGAPFPVLWEKEPDHNGLVVAAWSDGTVRVVTRRDLGAALGR